MAILLVGVTIGIIIFVMWKMNKKDDIPIQMTDIDEKEPVIIFNKSGGLMGMVRKLEIYEDKSYILYNHDKIFKTGIIGDEIYSNITYLVDTIPKLNIEKEGKKDPDMINHTIIIGDITFDPFGESVSEDIIKKYKPIDRFIDNPQ